MFLNRNIKIKMIKDFILVRDYYEVFLEVWVILIFIIYEYCF